MEPNPEPEPQLDADAVDAEELGAEELEVRLPLLAAACLEPQAMCVTCAGASSDCRPRPKPQHV
eukprot:COSAG03_NODE_453_length_7785_cov_2.919594_6_plen_64_part_00